ncbi:MAG TPA: sugar nucleotide-binding protein [Candidatus Fermentibacter daniensis]|nr:MAG: dTDP-4-dehydrorhamnose reductase [candidate division Hyd24-12 bacterium ADurb.Bin004]HPH38639.1 sugar nucleotide-binding protein [Candidatus Fermentibacter daniensis]
MPRAAPSSSAPEAETVPRLLLIGSGGRLGTAVRRAAGGDFDIHCPAHGEIAGAGLKALLSGPRRPDLIVNAAAMSSTSECAREPRLAFEANALLPRDLARACRGEGIRLVHISTDLVYGGHTPPYTESSPCVPLSVYGWTKLLGDRAVMAVCPGSLVLRTSVLFGGIGAPRRTFSEELLAGAVQKVHVDSFRNHTPAGWFAKAVLTAGMADVSGPLIASGLHSLSRSAFAEMLFRHLGLDGCPPAGYRPPGVPADLSLDTGRFARLFGEPPDPFQAFDMEYKKPS